jgi:hypothetical protein
MGLQQAIESERQRTLDEYLSDMSKINTWGDEFTWYAMVEHYKLAILLFSTAWDKPQLHAKKVWHNMKESTFTLPELSDRSDCT